MAGQALFTIDPGTGLLSFRIPPTFDPNGSNQYVVTIEATDVAGNRAAMTITVTVTQTLVNPADPNPAEIALERAREEIEQVILDAEVAKLRAEQMSMRSLTSGARDRLSAGGCGGTGDETSGSAADDESCRDFRHRDFNVVANGSTVSISGSGTSVRLSGDTRRIAQFDLQASRQADISNISLNGKLAYEFQRSDRALYGVFVGMSMGTSESERAVSGDISSAGVTLGAYAVHEFATNMFSEAYAAVGAARNQLQFGNETLTVDGEYDSTSLHLGWIVSGQIERGQWEFWPEVALQWSRSRTSSITVDGTVPGSSAIGNWSGLTATMGTAALATEIVYNFGTDDNPWSIRVKPGVLCNEIRARNNTSDCGAMLSLGVEHESTDGNRRISAEASMEDVGTETQRSAMLSYELRF